MKLNLILSIRLLHLLDHHDAELRKLNGSAPVRVNLVDHVLHLRCHHDDDDDEQEEDANDDVEDDADEEEDDDEDDECNSINHPSSNHHPDCCHHLNGKPLHLLGFGQETSSQSTVPANFYENHLETLQGLQICPTGQRRALLKERIF